MKNILKTLSLCCVLLFAVGCEEDNGVGDSSNIVTFESGSPIEFVEVGGTKTASVKIYTGNVSGSDRTIGISVDESTTLDAAAYSVPSSVTIPGGSNEATLEYQITDANIPLAGGTLVLALTDIGNLELVYGASTSGTAPNYSTIAIVVEYENCPPSNTTTIDITFDNYPEETSWVIYPDGDPSNILASTAEGDYAGQTSASQNVCLEGGDYVFEIFDVFSDGICCQYGNGSYTVTVNGVAVASGGSFGASEATNFTVN